MSGQNTLQKDNYLGWPQKNAKNSKKSLKFMKIRFVAALVYCRLCFFLVISAFLRG